MSEEETALKPAFNISNDVFVGREKEIALFGEALQAAKAGQTRIVALAGEPGIGKTRTAKTFVACAAQAGFQTLWTRCYENQSTPPYWPWIQALRSLAAQHEKKSCGRLWIRACSMG